MIDPVTPNPLLQVRDLTVTYLRRPVFGGRAVSVRAVDGVSLEIGRGETLGLVGESGCGKSTTGKAIVRLVKASGGSVQFQDTDVLRAHGSELRWLRRHMQIVFQDPYASLNPRMPIGRAIGDPLIVHNLRAKAARPARIAELLDQVGLEAAVSERRPRELSGGQRQRAAIARALAVEPEFLLCDEPVSALDVSIRAQILNLLIDLQSDLGLTYLFIAHDLAIVQRMSRRVAVMYLGKIVEVSNADELYETPMHPYTKALVSAIPIPDPRLERQRKRIVLSGEVPSPSDPPAGCRFSTRCPFVMDVCRVVEPPLVVQRPNHEVACHLYPPPASAPGT